MNEYNTISGIVDHFSTKKGLSTAHWFPWALAMALWHLRELKLDVWQEPVTKYLPVTDRKTVLLPSDYVDWTKIGVKVGQYAVTLGVNDELNTLNRTENDADIVRGLLSQNLPNGLDFGAYSGLRFFNFNGSTFNSIGLGLPGKGTFKVVDHGSCKEILLDYDFNADYLYVEYITDGFDPCGETLVHPYIADYVLKSIELSYEEDRNPSATESSIARKSQDQYFAMKKVRARRNGLDPKTLLQMSRAEVRFTAHI